MSLNMHKPARRDPLLAALCKIGIVSKKCLTMASYSQYDKVLGRFGTKIFLHRYRNSHFRLGTSENTV